jgi:hypothetical protein
MIPLQKTFAGNVIAAKIFSRPDRPADPAQNL